MNGRVPGYDVVESSRRFVGRVIAVRSDDVRMPDGTTATRDVVEHPGAVAVVALDAAGAVVLVSQYRHPVSERLWELPAGLLDVADESARHGAARELREEAGLEAANWSVLADVLTSPGMTNEAIRIFLARELTEVERPPGAAEEAELEIRHVPLDDAAEKIRAGSLRNGPACVGILAALAARPTHFRNLRPATSRWPDRPDR